MDAGNNAGNNGYTTPPPVAPNDIPPSAMEGYRKRKQELTEAAHNGDADRSVRRKLKKDFHDSLWWALHNLSRNRPFY